MGLFSLICGQRRHLCIRQCVFDTLVSFPSTLGLFYIHIRSLLTLALDTQKRPGTVGVPADRHGRGWLREKIRAPRALTAVVSPRRSVDQPLHGPQVLLYYMYMYLCVNLCMYIHTYVCTCYVLTNPPIPSSCVCMHTCMYVCIYV